MVGDSRSNKCCERCFNICCSLNKNYWKFNADLLNDEAYVEEVMALLGKSKSDVEIDPYCRKWEYLDDMENG